MPAAPLSALMTGAILIASGRVPMTDSIFRIRPNRWRAAGSQYPALSYSQERCLTLRRMVNVA